MQKNIIRLLIFFLTLFIGIGVYFLSVSNSVKETAFPASEISFSLLSSERQEKPSATDFYEIPSCTDVNPLKKYKYPRKSPTISHGVLNGLIICGTLPENVPIAKNGNSSETVKVDVFIDVTGEVIKARAVNGNSLQRQQVEKAVYQTRFCPTLLGGENMNVKGTLIYHFNNERGFSLRRQFPIRDNFKR